MLTIEEQERRAYISGNVELANALGAAMDLESDRVEEAEHDARELRREVDDLEKQLQVADERIAELEQELEDARA